MLTMWECMTSETRKARHKHSRERRKTGVIALPQADIFCPTVVGKQVRLPRQVLWVLKYSTIDWVIFCFFKSTRGKPAGLGRKSAFPTLKGSRPSVPAQIIIGPEETGYRGSRKEQAFVLRSLWWARIA